MLHAPAAKSGPDHATAYKMRLGVWMFIPYALIYAGFVLTNLIKPVLMEKIVCLGLNLAVVYGIGLIVLALVLALVYNHRCARQERILYAAPAEKGDR